MRSRTAPALLALLLVTGCASLAGPPPRMAMPGPVPPDAGIPAQTPVPDLVPPATPSAVESTPPAAPAIPPGPALPEAPVPPAAPPGPPAVSAPHAPAPAPPPAVAPGPSVHPPGPSGPPLTASLSPEETRRARDSAQRTVDEVSRLLRQIETRPLSPKDREVLVLAQSLLDQSKKALGTGEFERAANLAAKARTLADDLASRR